MEQITKEEMQAICSVMNKLGMGEMITAGEVLDEIDGVSFYDFFTNLPSMSVRIETDEKGQSFVDTLQDVSRTLYFITDAQQNIRKVNEFFRAIEMAKKYWDLISKKGGE